MAEVYNAEIYKNENCPNGCLRLFWDGEEGFGQYDLIIRSTSKEEPPLSDYKLKINGYSEYMDDNEDKSFLKSLLDSLLSQIDIDG